jgi:hypothetical protein
MGRRHGPERSKSNPGAIFCNLHDSVAGGILADPDKSGEVDPFEHVWRRPFCVSPVIKKAKVLEDKALGSSGYIPSFPLLGFAVAPPFPSIGKLSSAISMQSGRGSFFSGTFVGKV